MSDDYASLRDTGLEKLKQYMDSLDPKRAKILAYWLNDYTCFLQQERTFQPSRLIRYKRGSIVKVHLGYRVGSEEGGLHYAIVLDHNNAIHSPVITIIPLTSVKPNADVTNLHPSNVHLGSEIYSLLMQKLNGEIDSANKHLDDLRKLSDDGDNSPESHDTIQRQLQEIRQQLSYCRKMRREIDHMRQGSIALVGQITTISKIRIYDPQYRNDALSNIRVSSNTLDALDAKIKELFG